MAEKWYVTHIYRGENYLAKGPHDENGKPAICLQMMWEDQANYLKNFLNQLEKTNE